jgi:hypothetical protein
MPSGHINPAGGFGLVWITGEQSGAAFGGGSAELRCPSHITAAELMPPPR